MAQVEANMTLSKALALWKNNTGVMDIDGALDNQYRNLTLLKFQTILSGHIKTVNMLTFKQIENFAK
jgi:hypothetical protein